MIGSDFDTNGPSLTGLESGDKSSSSSSSSIWTETSVSKMKLFTIRFLCYKYGKMEHCQSLYFLDRQIVAVRRYDNWENHPLQFYTAKMTLPIYSIFLQGLQRWVLLERLY